MNIVIDKNIDFAKELFCFKDHTVSFFEPKDITAQNVKYANALIVRSSVKINEQLINDNIKFVGTCTSGSDHIDKQLLAKNNIVFADARGSNANAVVDYVLTALSILNVDFFNKTFAIVGFGEVGTRLVNKLNKFGVNLMICDPFKHGNFVNFQECLNADIISLHTPLTKDCAFATHFMLNKTNLNNLKENVILINSSRGEVINGDDLLQWKLKNNSAKLILDVFIGEPLPNPELVNIADIATPHIAGYSAIGRFMGSVMVYKKLCSFLKIEEDKTLIDELLKQINMRQAVQQDIKNFKDFQSFYEDFFHLEQLSMRFKESTKLLSSARSTQFTQFRKEQQNRAETIIL